MGLNWNDRQKIIENVQYEILNLEEYEGYRGNKKEKKFIDEVPNPVISITKELFFYNLHEYSKNLEEEFQIREIDVIKEEIKRELLLFIKRKKWINKERIKKISKIDVQDNIEAEIEIKNEIENTEIQSTL